MVFDELLAGLAPFKNLIFLTLALLGPLLFFHMCQLFGLERRYEPQFWGRLGLCLFLFMTASAHFTDPVAMAVMLPEFVPLREYIVVLTGFLEIGLGLAVLYIPVTRMMGWAIIAMLIGFLPANIYAALNHVPFGGAEMGPAYLLVRVPYQAFLVGFAFWTTQTGQHASTRRLGQLA